jgi:Flp pilus assembly protein TadG
LNNKSGASAVEFAIVASLFLTLALGVLAYGLYLGAAHSVSQLAADAARASIAGINDDERAKIAEGHATLHAEDFMFLDKQKITVAAAPLADINQFQVVVRFDAGDLPIWFMSGLLPLPPKTIERSATIRRGGY